MVDIRIGSFWFSASKKSKHFKYKVIHLGKSKKHKNIPIFTKQSLLNVKINSYLYKLKSMNITKVYIYIKNTLKKL